MLMSLTSYNNLGLVHEDLGELERAKEYHILAMEIEKENLVHNMLVSRRLTATLVQFIET